MKKQRLEKEKAFTQLPMRKTVRAHRRFDTQWDLTHMPAMSFLYQRINHQNYPITCCTRLRYFAGMGFSSFQTMFMGLLPVWLT